MGIKRGVFFTTDALIALVITLIVILIAFPISQNIISQNALQKDILVTLSTLEVSETQDSYLSQLKSSGLIDDENNTLLEQIGEFYVKNITIAKELSNSLLQDIETQDNIGLWFGNTLVWSKNNTPYESAKKIETRSQVISGLQQGEDTTGYSARAFLTNKLQTRYFYFGGYVGDGNITAKINYQGTIDSAQVELATTKDFTIYINGVFSGNYLGSSSQFEPIIYEVPISNFNTGENTLEIKGENLNIAGGFVKIRYNSDVQYTEEEKYYFPGIKGLINLYDGFYIPSVIKNMSANLILNTNFTTFLNIGSTTVYSGRTNGQETISLSDSIFSSFLDYSNISKKTIPLRLGMENVSYTTNITTYVDVYSVTDLSGSMCGSCSGSSFWCCFLNGGCNNNQPVCTSCSGTCSGPIETAKNATKLFVDAVLNSTENRVGLVGYATSASSSNFHALSNNTISLKSEISSWQASGNTCICCGIISATNNLTLNAREEAQKAIVVMSDGEATTRCYSGTGNAKQDAITAACNAYQTHGITVNAVGFGSSADETTLQQIASCGNGTYYFSDVNELASVYTQIAQDIIQGTYLEQTIDVSGDILTEISADSYIQFGYDKNESPFGLILTTEIPFSSETQGFFTIPSESEIIEVKAISYSGSRWTDKVLINNNLAYNLSLYGNIYTNLGDPYAINIPIEYINKTGSNEILITTANSPLNSTVGSINNKIILTILKNSTGFAPISAKAEGCLWTIEFENYNNLTFSVPSNYTGSEQCVYQENSEIYNENDALQTAVFNLLSDLDFDSDGLIDIYFDNQDLEIDSKEITGIPFVWSTEAQIRRWQI